MHSAAALEEDHIPGPGHPLQLAQDRRLICEGQGPVFRHAAGKAAADDPLRVGAIGQDPVHPLRGNAADAVVLRRRPVSQLQHIPQNRYLSPLSVSQNVEGRHHGFGASIVAVLNEGNTVGFKNLLPSGEIPEGVEPLADPRRKNTQLQTHSHSGHGVTDKMAAFQRHLYREGFPSGGDLEAQLSFRIAHLGALDLAAIVGAEVDELLLGLSVQVPQHHIVTVEQQLSTGLHALQNFHFSLADPRHSAQKLNMGRTDIDDDGNVRPGDLGQIGHLPEMVHPHFQHSHLRILRHSQDRHRHSDVVVMVDGGLGRPERGFQNGGHHLLGGALAYGAGDAHHLHSQALPLSRGDFSQCHTGILHHNGRDPVHGPAAQGRRRSLGHSLRDKVVAVPGSL